jgi:hypothetical protein
MLGHWYILLFQVDDPVVESETSPSGWVDAQQIAPKRNKSKRRRRNNATLHLLGTV